MPFRRWFSYLFTILNLDGLVEVRVTLNRSFAPKVIIGWFGPLAPVGLTSAGGGIVRISDLGAKRGEGPQSALRADMLRSPIPVALTDSMYIVGLWSIRPTASRARDQEPGCCGFVLCCSALFKFRSRSMPHVANSGFPVWQFVPHPHADIFTICILPERSRSDACGTCAVWFVVVSGRIWAQNRSARKVKLTEIKREYAILP